MKKESIQILVCQLAVTKKINILNESRPIEILLSSLPGVRDLGKDLLKLRFFSAFNKFLISF